MKGDGVSLREQVIPILWRILEISELSPNRKKNAELAFVRSVNSCLSLALRKRKKSTSPLVSLCPGSLPFHSQTTVSAFIIMVAFLL